MSLPQHLLQIFRFFKTGESFGSWFQVYYSFPHIRINWAINPKFHVVSWKSLYITIQLMIADICEPGLPLFESPLILLFFITVSLSFKIVDLSAASNWAFASNSCTERAIQHSTLCTIRGFLISFWFLISVVPLSMPSLTPLILLTLRPSDHSYL